MGDQYHLATFSCPAYAVNKKSHDRFVVQILFRLVNNDWNFLLVEQKVKDEEQRTFFPR